MFTQRQCQPARVYTAGRLSRPVFGAAHLGDSTRHHQSGNPTPQPQPGFENNITQQEGLRICFYELEVDVRNCQHAYQNNVAGYNDCITMAGESHTSCLTWVQKLPVEENSN
ncbi:hypothetical protein R2083_02060 [Nitrosomonas sp. Is35]|uniref:hypothetical protein n=1 Tax=Nitrosomonas sp. Is35 TaxID=3080534 RepID=UPI00294B814F|nr:hypothetical protein [Nitrosomonas sp. Is35]MDV6346305.1 hypothetical protein [Nitrosomonas sp. Is35]